MAILNGIRDLAIDQAAFVHGSTVATNAILERKGARTALITTEGFEDVLEIGRQNRKDIYDLMMDRPEPLVPASLRYGLPERIDYTGSVLVSPTDGDLAEIVDAVRKSGAEAVAVSLLFSFLNPLHENMVMEALASLNPKPFLSVSSQVLPEFREYERTSAVTVNAYVGPAMSGYLGNLEASLGSSLRIMQSSGGSITSCPGLPPTRADHSQRACGGSCRRFSRRVAGGLQRPDHHRHGGNVHRRISVSWQNQGDHHIRSGGLPRQRSYD